MAIDAGIKNIDELQEFGKQISQLGDQMNGLVPCLDQFLCLRRSFVLVIHDKVIESAQEAVNTVYSTVVPLGIKFRRSHEQLIHTQGIAAVISYQIIR